MSVGIYLPNMEMPASCPCELLGIGYDLYCSFAGGIPARVKEYYECCQNGTMPSWCPLVSVPEHGRLGDLDELYASLKKWLIQNRHSMTEATKVWIRGVLEGIAAAPTIIPAEPITAEEEKNDK